MELLVKRMVSTTEEDIFSLSTKTPFTQEDLKEYSDLTGKDFSAIEEIMIFYMENGINDLVQINKMIKLGHYKY